MSKSKRTKLDLSEQQAAEAERETILAKLAERAADETAPIPGEVITATERRVRGRTVSALDNLAAISDGPRENERAWHEADRAAKAAVLQPLYERGHSALTRYGLAKSKYRAQVDKAAALDLKTLIKRIPAVVTPGVDHALNHFRLHQYVTLARDLALTFDRVTFEDYNESLVAAQAIVNAVPGFDYPSVNDGFFTNAVRHLRWHLERVEAAAASVEERLQRFLVLDAQIAEDLAKATVTDTPVEPPVERIQDLPVTPAHLLRPTGSPDWDPRERDHAPDTRAKIVPVGDRAGYRVGSVQVPEWPKEGR